MGKQHKLFGIWESQSHEAVEGDLAGTKRSRCSVPMFLLGVVNVILQNRFRIFLRIILVFSRLIALLMLLDAAYVMGEVTGVWFCVLQGKSIQLAFPFCKARLMPAACQRMLH